MAIQYGKRIDQVVYGPDCHGFEAEDWRALAKAALCQAGETTPELPSLRDLFAGEALGAMQISDLPVQDDGARAVTLRAFARAAYDLADALLAERARRAK